MKNKTLAAWLAFIAGPFGLHRFYLQGRRDWIGWLLPLPTLIGLYGVYRARDIGLDDRLSWLLIPLLGFTVAGCALTAIVYGLTSAEKWNDRFNRSEPSDTEAGSTNWLTIAAVVFSLLFGTTALMSAIAFTFQRYFEYQA